MAKYIGTLTSDARGKVGGLVLTRARNGTNLKAHAVGVNPRSTYQLSLRQSFASAIAQWRALTTSQQQTWALLAPQYTYVNTLGQSYSPTALQLYTQAWMNATLSATAPPASAPTSPPFINQLLAVTLSFFPFTLTASATQSGPAPYSGAYTLSLSAPLSASISYTRGTRRRPMGFTLSGPGFDVTAAYLTAFGRVAGIGALIAYRAVPFDPVSFISAAPVIGTAAVS